MVDEPYRGSNLGPLSKLKTLTEDYIDPLTGANYGATNEDRPKLRHMIEPDLTQIQTGKYDIPENVYIDPLGVPRNKDDGQKIEIIRRPNVLPFVNTPQGVELAMPKIVDVVGNIMGGVVAPVKGAGTVLGAGPVLKAGEKAIEAATEVKPFYSALENQVNTVNQAKMTGDQWLGTLGNKAGIKPEEMQYTGLNDFLNSKKGQTVTKQEVADYLKNNKVEVNDVWKGNTANFETADRVKIINDFKNLKDEIGQEFYDFFPFIEKNKSIENQAKQWFDNTIKNEPELLKNYISINDTKYHSYQLPGGENYRELLMTLPDKQKRLYKWEYFDPKTQQSKQFKTEAEAKAAAPEGAIVNQKEVAELNPSYNSSHWDEPNILAHMRMNDRTIDGKKSLHLEEIQSDWHQAGRDKGYRGQPESYEVSYIDDDGYRTKVNVADKARAEAELKRLQSEGADEPKLTPVFGESGVPDAPFKKNWHELALKRALQEAVENGYDRLSWTPGEAQAARYDLSKQVDKIAVPTVTEGNRSVRIDGKNGDSFKLMVDKTGKVQGHYSAAQFDGKQLSDVVGKEMADKIMKLDAPHEFAGEGLRIGGEGMKGFYDNIIPKSIEKLGKEFGVKVQKLEKSLPRFAVYQRINKISPDFENAAEARAWGKEHGFEGKATVRESVEGNPHSLYYIDIPPAMREKILKQGQPLFATPNLTPVQHDPFKTTPIDYNPDFL